MHFAFCRQSQVVGSAAHPGHSHSHHGMSHPAHLSPGGSGGGRSPTGGPVIGSAQHLGQPLYQEYAHVRSRAHAVPPPVYVTAAPSQAATAIQQPQVPTYQGFTPGCVPSYLDDLHAYCTCRIPYYAFAPNVSCHHIHVSSCTSMYVRLCHFETELRPVNTFSLRIRFIYRSRCMFDMTKRVSLMLNLRLS